MASIPSRSPTKPSPHGRATRSLDCCRRLIWTRRMRMALLCKRHGSATRSAKRGSRALRPNKRRRAPSAEQSPLHPGLGKLPKRDVVFFSIRQFSPIRHGHQCCGHRCDQFLICAALAGRVRFSLCDRQRSSGFQHGAAKHEQISLRWRKEIDLELSGQYGRLFRHQCERGIAACAVENCRNDAGMQKPMLLYS